MLCGHIGMIRIFFGIIYFKQIIGWSLAIRGSRFAAEFHIL